eukprot:GHVS01045303.1.p1 GENE.GHVS01045303.1~~GHVS01045303.1.p1  ORF type:complete len:232 (+),score=25.70 GHVS01045303.1:69-764(+)
MLPNSSGGSTNSGEKRGQLVVHNVLMSSQVSCPLDLDVCCCHFGNAVYNPEDFRCLRVDVRSTSGELISISIFSNGKMQATGGRTIASTRRSLKKVAKRLKSSPLNYPVAFKKPEVSNMLAVFDLGYSINLVLLSRGCRGTDYEPERFPGARIKIPIPPSQSTAPRRRQHGSSKEEVVTSSVFSTGKVSLVAGRSQESLQYAAQAVERIVQEYRAISLDNIPADINEPMAW